MLKIVLPVIFGVFVLGFIGFSQDVYAIGGTVSDQTSCEAIGGVWSTPPDTCTVTGNLIIDSGQTLTVNSDVILTVTGLIKNDGSIINDGTINANEILNGFAFGSDLAVEGSIDNTGGTINGDIYNGVGADNVNGVGNGTGSIDNTGGTINGFIENGIGGSVIDPDDGDGGDGTGSIDNTGGTINGNIQNGIGGESMFSEIGGDGTGTIIVTGGAINGSITSGFDGDGTNGGDGIGIFLASDAGVVTCGTGTELEGNECVVDPNLTVISTDTVLETSTVVNGSVLVQSNSILTIPSGVTLTIPTENHLRIEPGSGVLIKAGGTLKVLS